MARGSDAIQGLSSYCETGLLRWPPSWVASVVGSSHARRSSPSLRLLAQFHFTTPKLYFTMKVSMIVMFLAAFAASVCVGAAAASDLES